MYLDLGSCESVVEFAETVKKTETRLDILINNAGIFYHPRTMTKDGFEMTFQVNYLGHFLLTQLLLDLLKSSQPSRIVNVSSTGYRHCDGINFDDIHLEKNYGQFKMYAQSKLAVLYFTRKLARNLNNTGVLAFSIHPGMVATKIGRRMPYVGSWIFRWIINPVVGKLFCKNSQQGAQTSIYCAVEETLHDKSGSYFSDCREEALRPVACDDVSGEKLWNESMRMLKDWLP